MFGAISSDVWQSLYAWIDISSMGRLDSALCNQLQRNLLLCDFNSSWIALSSQKKQLSPLCLHWIYTRNIKLKDLVVHPKLVSDDTDLIFKINTSKIKYLEFYFASKFELTDSSIVALINSCLEITSLVLSSVRMFSDEMLLQIDTSILSALNVLTLSHCYLYDVNTLTPKSIKHLAAYSHNLTSFSVDFPGMHSINDELLDLINGNKNLTCLAVSNITELQPILAALRTNCIGIVEVKLVTLNLANSASIIHSLLDLISNCLSTTWVRSGVKRRART